MLQLLRLVTLLCKFYILTSSPHQQTYKGTHWLYILRLEASFYTWEHFLIQSLPLILNRFCSVFQFHWYIRGCLAGHYILFHRIIAKIVRFELKLLKDRVIDIIENWSNTTSIVLPCNILFLQHVFLSIVRCIEFHRVFCAVDIRNVCELNNFYHLCCAFGIVAVANC